MGAGLSQPPDEFTTVNNEPSIPYERVELSGESGSTPYDRIELSGESGSVKESFTAPTVSSDPSRNISGEPRRTEKELYYMDMFKEDVSNILVGPLGPGATQRIIEHELKLIDQIEDSNAREQLLYTRMSNEYISSKYGSIENIIDVVSGRKGEYRNFYDSIEKELKNVFGDMQADGKYVYVMAAVHFFDRLSNDRKKIYDILIVQTIRVKLIL